MLARVRRMSAAERIALLTAYVGERTNRRHRPGRAFERTGYRFDVVSDYGAFRDLQRHRMLTIEWQSLTPMHGYEVPDGIVASGLGDQFEEEMARSAVLHDELEDQFPLEAPYAVALAYRIRYAMQMNAREAMHVLELRTTPQGHPAYRRVCQEMHHLIADQAGPPCDRCGDVARRPLRPRALPSWGRSGRRRLVEKRDNAEPLARLRRLRLVPASGRQSHTERLSA